MSESEKERKRWSGVERDRERERDIRYACTNKMNYDAFMPMQWPLITDISFIWSAILFTSEDLKTQIQPVCENKQFTQQLCLIESILNCSAWIYLRTFCKLLCWDFSSLLHEIGKWLVVYRLCLQLFSHEGKLYRTQYMCMKRMLDLLTMI